MISFFTFETTKTLFWRRLIASLVDFVLVYLVTIILAVWITPLGYLFNWTFIWLLLLYGTIMDAYKEGTFGKMYVDLRVARQDNSKPKLIDAFYRNFMKLIISCFLYDILLLMIRRGYSGYHNKIAKTTVISKY